MVGSYREGDDAELAALYLASRGIESQVAHAIEIRGAHAYEAAIGVSTIGGAFAGSLVGLVLTPLGIEPATGPILPMYTGILGGLAIGALAGLFGYPAHACRLCFANPADRFGLFVDEALADRAVRLLTGR